jgi:hypothetical protein
MGIRLNMKIREAIYEEIRNIIEQTRSQSSRAVNFAMVQAYWNIGQVMMEEEQKGGTRQLERQINSFYYESILTSGDKKAVKDEANIQKNILKPLQRFF